MSDSLRPTTPNVVRAIRTLAAITSIGFALLACTSSVDGAGKPRVDPELKLRPTGNVAVSATVDAWAELVCEDAETCTTPPNAEVVIERASVDDASIFAIERKPDYEGAVFLHALRDGTTTLRVTARSGDKRKDLVSTLEARTPDKVTLDGDCRGARPLVIGTNTSIPVNATLSHENRTLSGWPDPFPITLTEGIAGLTLSPRFFGFELDGRSTAARGSVQSNLDPADTLAIEIVDTVTRVALEPPANAERLDGNVLLARGGSMDFDIKLFAGERPICRDSFERKIVVGTPTSCQVTLAAGQLMVRGEESGTCTFDVIAGGTTGHASLEVRRID